MRKVSDYLFFFIIGGLMIFSLAYNIIFATVIPVSIPVIIFSVIFFLIVFAIIFNNHYTFLITLGFLAAAALIIFVGWDSSWLSDSNATGIFAYFRDLIMFIRGYLPYEDSYGPVITIFVCGFLALYMTLSLYISFQFYFTALLGIGVFVVNWIMDYKHSDISFIIFIFCFCVLLYKKMNNRKVDVNRMAIYMMPACLLVMTCAYSLPTANKEWDTKGAVDLFKNPLETTNDFFYFIFNPKYFSFQSTGFEGRNGRLGGSLNMNNRDVMQVKAERPAYLSGYIKDTYTGDAWLNSKPGFRLPYSKDDACFELNETQFNLPLHISYDQNGDWSLSHNQPVRQLTVNIGASKTGTIFRPMKNNGVKIDTKLNILTDSYGDICLSDVMSANAEYSFDYLDINYSDEAVQDVLRQSHRGMYSEAVEAGLYTDSIELLTQAGNSNTFGGFDENDARLYGQKFKWGLLEYAHRSWPEVNTFDLIEYFNDKLIPYADYVYKTFLGVPEIVPQRVRDLAYELTAQANNDYDRAKAIESYLIKFPYTLMPGDPPRDQDFVDYFLFDGKEGYCTYYASAMAILCRCIGLPTRYVEGYAMPPDGSVNGIYNITNLQAHAWVEAYFEGFGWVPFEPTAPYSFNFYQVTPPLNTQVFTQDFAADPQYEEYIERMMGGPVAYPGVNAKQVPVPDSKSNIANMITSALTAAAVIVLIGACFGLLVLRGMFNIWRRKKRINRLPRNEQAIEYFREIIKMTRYYRYPMREYETPVMYANRIGKRFAFKSDSIFIRDLVVIYNNAKYGGDQIRKTDLNLMKACNEELLAFIRFIKRKPIFIWNRYISRRI